MESKSSSALPLLLVAGLVVVVGGAIFYFVMGANTKLTTPGATIAVNAILRARERRRSNSALAPLFPA